MPLISVVVPVYKAEKHITQCVCSIFEQDYPNLEIIFWDDCSPDDSISLIQEEVKNYPLREKQVYFFKNPVNRGVAYSRHNAYLKAQGKYILTIDSDDWIECDTCSKLASIAEETKADIVFFDFQIEEAEKSYQMSMLAPLEASAFSKELLKSTLNGTLCNKLIRRELYTNCNIDVPIGLAVGEDCCITFQLLQQIPKLVYIDHSFYHYRMNPESVTHIKNRMFYENEIAFIEFLDLKLDNPTYRICFSRFKVMVKLQIILSCAFPRKKAYALFPEINDILFKIEEVPFLYKLALYFYSKRCSIFAMGCIKLKFLMQKLVNTFG